MAVNRTAAARHPNSQSELGAITEGHCVGWRSWALSMPDCWRAGEWRDIHGRSIVSWLTSTYDRSTPNPAFEFTERRPTGVSRYAEFCIEQRIFGSASRHPMFDDSHSRQPPTGGTLYLVRVVVDASPSAETVVTVYRTTKVEKYWSKA